MTAATTPTPSTRSAPRAPFDVERIRAGFPDSRPAVRGKPLVYLDNAATTQKPQAVIDAVTRFYAAENANIHRGVHYLSERATAAYEAVRETVARFLNAPSRREIVFTRGTTEAINLVAQSFGRSALGPGRRNPDHGDGASLEHRALAAAVARQTGRRASRRRRSPTPASSTSRPSTRLLAVAPARRRRRTSPTRSAPSIRCGRWSRCAHARGAACWWTARSARRTCAVDVQALGLRLLRVLRAQDLRPDRRRRAVRPASAAGARCRRGRAAAT